MATKTELLESELEAVTAKKEMYFAKVHRMYEYTKNLDDPAVLANFKADYHFLDQAVKNIATLVDQSNTLSKTLDVDYIFNYSTVDNVEQLCGHIREAYLRVTRGGDYKLANICGPSSLPKLPKIDLIEFHGDKRQWPIFIETFNSLVHNNSNLDDTARVHYLLSCLKGAAQSLCVSVLPTASNYSILLRTLKDRYEDKRLLANVYLSQILDFKSAQTESLACLNAFLEKFDTAVNALKNLKLTDLLDYILVYIGLSKLDSQTHKYFEMKRDNLDIPTYSELIEFIKLQIKSLSHSTKTTNLIRSSPRIRNFTQAYVTGSQPRISCILCHDTHLLFLCNRFAKLKPLDRFKVVKDNQLCLNCLSSQHKISTCKSSNRCKYCSKQHHSMLHFDNNSNKPAQSTTVPQADGDAIVGAPATKNVQPTVSNFCSALKSNSNLVTLLPTAIVDVYSPLGVSLQARFLIDTASQSHFLTTSLCTRLGVHISRRKLTVLGIGGCSQAIKGYADICIVSRINSNITFNISALVVDKITEQLPSVEAKLDELGYLTGLTLADAGYFKPGPIDGILGADLFPHILGNGRLSAHVGLPVAVETSLGYVVMGKAPIAESLDYISQTFCAVGEDNCSSLNAVLEKFWEVEEVGCAPSLSHEDQVCESFYSSSVCRDHEGRYTVALPFIENAPGLGDSLNVALKRFLSLEKKLHSNAALKIKYFEAFQDYITQGHMTYCCTLDDWCPDIGYFVPHFPVLKDSISTPLRIVFDSSMKTSNMCSLNDQIYSGVKLQTDIMKILVNFRLFEIALVSDVRQMYRNIFIRKEDRKYQRVLWRTSPEQPVSIYEMNRVSFGLKTAPFLALRTIQQLASDEATRFPLAAHCVGNDLYVDDVVSSVPTIEDAKILFSQLVGLFNAGGFELVKWTTNSPQVLEHIPQKLRLAKVINFDDPESIYSFTKVLGLQWNSTSDMFYFKVYTPDDNMYTKRKILSTIARIWDPLGFLSPVTLIAKLMMRELWLCKIDWDEAPPDSIVNRWHQFVTELSQLENLPVPRYIGALSDSQLSLIGFSDASQKGLGAMVYVRVVSGGQTRVHLLCAKSKVSPVKTVSIARLELCGALLLAKVLHYIANCFSQKFKIDNTWACIDSTVVLNWINGSPHKWETFVANRVSKIQSLLVKNCWFHINGSDNPADCLSRGLQPAELANHSTWFEGPAWLLDSPLNWPIRKLTLVDPSNKDEESIALPALVLKEGPLDALLSRISSWQKLLRIIVYVSRFCKFVPCSHLIDAPALSQAEKIVLKLIQRHHFSAEFQLLQEGQNCSHAFRHLTPFLDSDGLIRVGGRLGKAALEFDRQHPYLLPKSNHVVEILVFHFHERNFHTGPSLLLSLLRQKYWILSGRSVVRKCIRQCNYCFRFKPKAILPIMADLPSVRISEAKPFLHTGVDYGGPFHVTITRRRGIRTEKAYICLFVCLVTKALHLELASSLSTEAFLNCFKRFLSRRGSCNVMYSDCGTNFVGASSELREIFRFTRSKDYEAQIVGALTTRGIEWKFNPPHAPHFGGMWEANIKSVKSHLVKAIGSQILSYEEFSTVLAQIEALLNSRPICWSSSNPSDPTALTPSHFLTLSPLQNLPVLDSSENSSILVRKHLLDQIIASYWKRWHLTYLHELQSRQKWNTHSNPAREGMLVIMQEDKIPPLHWPIGVIEKLYPGSDGVSRVATVRTQGGSYKRPVVKLCPLPTQ